MISSGFLVMVPCVKCLRCHTQACLRIHLLCTELCIEDFEFGSRSFAMLAEAVIHKLEGRQ